MALWWLIQAPQRERNIPARANISSQVRFWLLEAACSFACIVKPILISSQRQQFFSARTLINIWCEQSLKISSVMYNSHKLQLGHIIINDACRLSSSLSWDTSARKIEYFVRCNWCAWLLIELPNQPHELLPCDDVCQIWDRCMGRIQCAKSRWSGHV